MPDIVVVHQLSNGLAVPRPGDAGVSMNSNLSGLSGPTLVHSSLRTVIGQSERAGPDSLVAKEEDPVSPTTNWL